MSTTRDDLVGMGWEPGFGAVKAEFGAELGKNPSAEMAKSILGNSQETTAVSFAHLLECLVRSTNQEAPASPESCVAVPIQCVDFSGSDLRFISPVTPAWHDFTRLFLLSKSYSSKSSFSLKPSLEVLNVSAALLKTWLRKYLIALMLHLYHN